jgi:hypothetical protein
MVVRRGRSFAVLGILGIVLASGACGSEDESGIVFIGDFETSGRSQWEGAYQCENGTTPDTATTNRGIITIVSDVVAKGTKAARFDLPSDASRVQACEALRGRELGTGPGLPPNEVWYALSIRFPTTGYTTNAWGLRVVSFNYQGIWGAPLGLDAHSPGSGPGGARGDGTNHVDLAGQAGLCYPVGTADPGGPRCEWSGHWQIIPSNRFALGVWHDVLVHVKWTTNPSEGLFEGFHRQRGGTWSQTVPRVTGRATVQTNRHGSAPRPANTVVDKIGAYRHKNAQAISIWHDNFCVATTRAAAESCL